MTETNRVRAKELVGLYAASLGVMFIGIGVLRFLFGFRGARLENLSTAFGEFCMLGITLLWAYGAKHLTGRELGLHKGCWGTARSVLYGFAAGTVMFLVPLFLIFFFSEANQVIISPRKHWAIWAVVAPFTVKGISGLVVGPIGEELFHRGLVYSYLKTKLNIPWSLLTQALIFTVTHPFYIARGGVSHIAIYFVGGLVLGLLFEKSRSLYPGILAHSTLNYGNILLGLLLQKAPS